MAALAFKEPDIPGVGEKVDKAFVVDLPRTLYGPLLTITADAASIIVSRALIEKTASGSGTTWKTEKERLQLIAADDARELLGRFKSGAGSSDNAAVAAATLGHSRYLVAKLLRSGCCMVIPAGSRELVSRIIVRYLGDHPAELVGHGMRLLHGPGRSELISRLGLAMDDADFSFCQDHFRSEGRDPTLTEIRLLDTDRIQTAAFPLVKFPAGKATVLRFRILEVHRGERYRDTAISELLFEGVGVH